jgi:pantothenate kinase
MDGFHLANEELARLGRAERKGAPDTFDVFGYRSLLERLRARRPSETVYAPVFQRKIEQAIAGFIPVGPEVELIITEGNYLLLGDGPWAPVATMLDKCWFIEVAEEEQRRRLLERHTGNGRSRDAALAWIEHTDMPNARRIAASRHRAHQIILTGGAPLS